MSEEIFNIVLAAIAARRLVLFTGAGLSMPAPSNLPLARALAVQCADKHEMLTDQLLGADVRDNIEAQARLFHERGQLQSYFLERLVDWRPFNGQPNAGHYAIADLLLCGAADLSVSANVDALVELAAEALGEVQFVSCILGSEAAVPRHYQPLLKIHGCIRRGVASTLWCKEQLAEAEWVSRIDDSVTWLAGNLTQRDIVFIGYWTDWAYLNEVLNRVLSDKTPRSVTLVDPSPPEVLEAKAPDLWLWAHRNGIAFHHLQLSGSEFLEELRRRFSRILLKRIAAVGRTAFATSSGSICPAFPSLDSCSTEDLYDLRRDWSGVRRDETTARNDSDSSDELLGKVFYDLVAVGGVLDGNAIMVAGKRVRIFQASGRMLYSVKTQLTGDVTSFNAPEVTVCVGAHDDGGVPADIVRADRGSTIIRPGISGDWCTHETAYALLGV
jgi:hypothetical protein